MTFEEFAVDRLPGVLRFAAVVTGDRALAEDLVQEVLIRAHARWRKIGSLDRPEYYVRRRLLSDAFKEGQDALGELPGGWFVVGGQAAVGEQVPVARVGE